VCWYLRAGFFIAGVDLKVVFDLLPIRVLVASLDAQDIVPGFAVELRLDDVLIQVGRQDLWARLE